MQKHFAGASPFRELRRSKFDCFAKVKNIVHLRLEVERERAALGGLREHVHRAYLPMDTSTYYKTHILSKIALKKDEISMNRRGKRYPDVFVPQLTERDCGAACLAMVLSFWGIPINFDEVLNALPVGACGASAQSLIEAAERFGLIAEGQRFALKLIGEIPPGSILHWNSDHFVVLVKPSSEEIEILDPLIGPRRIPRKELGEYFSGVTLLFHSPLTTRAQ